MAVNMTSAARNYLPNFQTKHTTILKPHSLGCLTDPSNSNYLCLNSPSLAIPVHSPIPHLKGQSRIHPEIQTQTSGVILDSSLHFTS